MINGISNIFNNNVITTLIISIIPTIELKGGIVFARGVGLSFLLSFLLAYIGSTVVFFLIFFLLKPILDLLKKIKWFNGFANSVENYFQKKADETLEKSLEKNNGKGRTKEFIKKLSVFIFVAIPLPFTGVWTGTAIAVFLDLKFSEAVLPIVSGNFVAGLLISLLVVLCNLLNINLDYVLYVLLGLALIGIIIVIIKVLQKSKNSEDIK